MMTNAYHEEIVRLLMKCGREGLRVSEISRFIYNRHAGLFSDSPSFASIHQTLRCYLWRQSTLRRSPFRRVQYGVYAIKSDMAIQLDFNFDRPVCSDAEEKESDLRPNYNALNDPRQLLLFPEVN